MSDPSGYRVRVTIEAPDGREVCEPMVFPLDAEHRFLSLAETPLRMDSETLCRGVHVHAWIAHARPGLPALEAEHPPETLIARDPNCDGMRP